MPSILDMFEHLVHTDCEPARFVPQTPCWKWLGVIGARGYGMAYYNGKSYVASRLAYTLEHGAIPEGMLVCHTCDNKWCVNPEHLFLGTNSDNQRDRIKWKAQLSKADLQSIKDSLKPSHILAREWKLSIKQIEAIRPPRQYQKRVCAR